MELTQIYVHLDEWRLAVSNSTAWRLEGRRYRLGWWIWGGTPHNEARWQLMLQGKAEWE